MKPITALSLSNDAIRAAVIANPYTERPQILQYRTVGLPTGAVVDGEVVDPQTMTGLLRGLIKNAKFPKDLALVYTSRRVVYREMTFPEMPLAELHDTLPFQVKNYIALPVDDSIIDFVPLTREEQAQGAVLHGMVVATLRTGVEKTTTAIQNAGFAVRSVDVSAFSLARVFRDQSRDKAIAVVNVGSNSTDVIILSQGPPVALRAVPSGADDITQAVAKALDIPFDGALEIKNRIGLQNVVGDERLEKAEEIIRDTTAQLIVGIRNTLNVYNTDHPAMVADDIVLVGAGSMLAGFPPVLASSTNKTVTIGDPFTHFIVGEDAKRQNINVHGPEYAAVLGLALGKRPR